MFKNKRVWIVWIVLALLGSAGIMIVTGHSSTLDSKQLLGKELFFADISRPAGQSCATCHAQEVGWTGPASDLNAHGSVYRGAVSQRFGNRKPPASGYATASPKLHFSAADRILVGGNFWDGRATGWELGSPAADQAKGPFLNPVEHNMPSKKSVCTQLSTSSEIAALFEKVWGKGSLDCSDEKVSETYNKIALAIAAYEDSSEVNTFSSKFDAWRGGKAKLTDAETRGWKLYSGKGKCAQCHTLNDPDVEGDKDLFTDFTYDNLGLPRNPDNPFYNMNSVVLENGKPINPEGRAWIDPGLGGFLASLADPTDQTWRALPYVTNVKNFSNEELRKLAEQYYGKHRVPTLRNVEKKGNADVVKAFGHNGYFKSVWSIVHFYNTRDVKPACEDPFTDEKTALAQGCWPVPEVSKNVNSTELGNLGMTRQEEEDLVAFLATLSDGWIK
ncbi:MAG TPA: cytochrome c peroxidase [Oculatellaceae cyanobacterium]